MAAVVVAFLVLSLIASVLVLAAVIIASRADEVSAQHRERSVTYTQPADTGPVEDRELERLPQ